MRYLLSRLAFTVLLTLFLLFWIHRMEDYRNYWDISWVSVVLFVFMSVALYLISKIAVKSPNKQIFISIALGNLFVKFLVTALILGAYYKFAQPVDTKFVLPYLVIYISFTIFETVLLLRISDGKI
jgi:hypothetical protein